MPNKPNAKKALRQSKKRAERNLVFKKAYKLAVKNAKKAIDAGEEKLDDKLKLAQKN